MIYHAPLHTAAPTAAEERNKKKCQSRGAFVRNLCLQIRIEYAFAATPRAAIYGSLLRKAGLKIRIYTTLDAARRLKSAT